MSSQERLTDSSRSKDTIVRRNLLLTAIEQVPANLGLYPATVHILKVKQCSSSSTIASFIWSIIISNLIGTWTQEKARKYAAEQQTKGWIAIGDSGQIDLDTTWSIDKRISQVISFFIKYLIQLNYPQDGLFPSENLEDPAKFNKTFDALKSLSDKGGIIIGFGITGGPGPYPDNAVNPAWRDTAIQVISAINFPEGSSQDVVAKKSKTLTNDWMKPQREVTPGGGIHASEADVIKPNFQQLFYGADKYKRLLSIKDKVDPSGLFYALQGVGSKWMVYPPRMGISAGCSHEYVTKEEGKVVSNDDQNMVL